MTIIKKCPQVRDTLMSKLFYHYPNLKYPFQIQQLRNSFEWINRGVVEYTQAVTIHLFWCSLLNWRLVLTVALYPQHQMDYLAFSKYLLICMGLGLHGGIQFAQHPLPGWWDGRREKAPKWKSKGLWAGFTLPSAGSGTPGKLLNCSCGSVSHL